jgi:hypothetical protein
VRPQAWKILRSPAVKETFEETIYIEPNYEDKGGL